LLQLDHQRKPKNWLQNEDQVRGDKQNYPWSMMIVCLEDCRMLLDFFRNHATSNKGVTVLLERMDDVEALQADSNSPADFSLSQVSGAGSLNPYSPSPEVECKQASSPSQNYRNLSEHSESFVSDSRRCSVI